MEAAAPFAGAPVAAGAAGAPAFAAAPGFGAMQPSGAPMAAPSLLHHQRIAGLTTGSYVGTEEAKHWEERRSRRLHVTPLSLEVTSDVLQGFFAQCGEVVDLTLLHHPDGTHKYAFVEFKTVGEAQNALQMSGVTIGAHEVKIKPSNPKPVNTVQNDFCYQEKTPEEVHNEWQYTHMLFENKEKYKVWLQRQEQKKLEKKARKEEKLRRKLAKLEAGDGGSGSGSDKRKKKKKKKRRRESTPSDSSGRGKREKTRRRRDRSRSSTLPSPPRLALG
eukprot:TRINITY_DN6220_c2_g1_i2.p1 TRINITY_DN6220_c2_g1~~TRINITY_DN6220_c2_g1_i2.p1  ORF type:complete len:299 (+),score=120.79 TRINITY_DN6220_c2_g1_i2:73-897(+)